MWNSPPLPFRGLIVEITDLQAYCVVAQCELVDLFLNYCEMFRDLASKSKLVRAAVFVELYQFLVIFADCLFQDGYTVHVLNDSKCSSPP